MLPEIQDYLRFAASQGRLTSCFGPLLCTITPTWDNAYVNYAIPDDNAEPSDADVLALIAFFRTHARLPRFEYIPEVAPRLQHFLNTHGFTMESFHPLMVATPSHHSTAPEVAGFEIRAPRNPQEIGAMLAAQHAAYDQPPPSDADIQRHVDSVSRGTLVVCAIETATGACAGGGAGTTPRDGVTELAGVGVRREFARRGIGLAITSELLRQCELRGLRHPFLMASDESVARMYARAGFHTVGRVLHIGMPT